MNKQLRYSTHLLAILLMAGSMQSLMANTILFCNESDKSYSPHKIEAKVIFRAEVNNDLLLLDKTLIIDPGEEFLWSSVWASCVVKKIKVQALESSTQDDLTDSPLDCYVIGIYNRRSPQFTNMDDAKQTSHAFSNGESHDIMNPIDKDLKVIYKENDAYQVDLLDPNKQ